MSSRSDEARRAYGDKALASTAAELGNTGPGSRHNELIKAAFKLGRLVPGGALEGSEIVAALRAACERNGSLREDGERQALKTIQDGIAAGSREPKTDWKEEKPARRRRKRAEKKKGEVPEEGTPRAETGDYPDKREVGQLWKRCVSVAKDPETLTWLRDKRHNIDPDLVAEQDLARVCALQEYAWPAWTGPKDPSPHWKPWPLYGLRLVVPMVDAGAEPRNLKFRRTFEEGDPRLRAQKDGRTWPPKSLARKSVRALVMANEAARALLQAGKWESDRPDDRRVVLIAEGEMDYLSAATRCAGAWSPAVFGMVSGSWTEKLAKQVPDGSTILIAVDPDPAGDEYADKTAETLVSREVQIRRWKGTDGAADVEECDDFSIDDPSQWTDVDLGAVDKRARFARGPLLKVNDQGVPLRTGMNIFEVLTCDARWDGVLAYHERRNDVFLQKPPPCRVIDKAFPRVITDEDLGALSLWLEAEWKLAVQSKADALLTAVIQAAGLHVIEPVRDYLEQLRWDGTPRLDAMLARYFGCEDTKLTADFGAKWMISAVARTYRPGCKADHVLTFVGTQGARKSSALQILAGEDHFTDHLPDLRNKDAADSLRGLWIIELGELDTLKRNEMSTTKQFITRQKDRYRPSYGKLTADFPRRCVFAASTNEEECLRDSTGNRRFWPVRAGEQVDIEGLRGARDQLWAEAVHRFKADEPWWLDREMEALARDKQDEHYQEDAWLDTIHDWLCSGPRAATPQFTSGEILKGALEIDVSRWTKADQMRLGGIMQRLGWHKARVRLPNGARPQCYCRPVAEPTDRPPSGGPDRPQTTWDQPGPAGWSSATPRNQAAVPTGPTRPTSPLNGEKVRSREDAAPGRARGFKGTAGPVGPVGPSLATDEVPDRPASPANENDGRAAPELPAFVEEQGVELERGII